MLRGGYLSLYFCIFLGPALGSGDLQIKSDACVVTGMLREKLQYKNRLQFMKHYFPIDYRIRVPHEGVLRLANITRLQQAKVSESNLQYLWASLNCNTMEILQDILMEKHPSWKYINEIYELLVTVRESTMDLQVDPRVEDILRTANLGKDRKLVKPKALLDNCYKVMELLYCLCCKETNIRVWEDCVVPEAHLHSLQPPPQCAGLSTMMYYPSQAQTPLVREGELTLPQVEANPSGKAKLGEDRFIP